MASWRKKIIKMAMQHIDTKNDYMELIHFHVVNDTKMNIYDKIRKHHSDILKKIENGVLNKSDDRVCLWAYKYIRTMTPEDKQEAIKMYGYFNIIREMPKIAEDNSWVNCEHLLDEEDDDIEKKILLHIIQSIIE